ncbi:Protein ltv1 [Microbotryomycetes sp. JL221]|nr:Protein ltv1 [Microbotryomycetes sp. JL221]
MSLWRRPGTRTFKLVHRSQRDPLINDPEASDHVLAEVVSAQQQRKGKNTPNRRLDEFAGNEAEFGDAAAYGIYFDDTEYDYMQHLRTVGSTTDAYLVEAEPARKSKARAGGDEAIQLKPEPGQEDHKQANAQPSSSKAQGIQRFTMPEEALPSHPLDETSYLELTSGQAHAKGLRPDMDPRIREVLEALDDEAFAVGDGEASDEEDDFFRDVVEGGEVEAGEWADESDEGSLERAAHFYQSREYEDDADAPLESRVARFKASKQQAGADSDEFESEQGDTVAELQASRQARKQAGKKPAGSQFSMSSSAMFRNEGLRGLDERFDQIEKMYDESSDDEWDQYDDDEAAQGDDLDDDDYVPPLISAREDLDAIFDDFLSRYEVLGGKMKPVLDAAPGTDGNMGKLERLRQELTKLDVGNDSQASERQQEKDRILAAVRRQQKEDKHRSERIDIAFVQPKERWDCETVLSTYSNASNHPRLLRLRDAGPRPPRIRVDRTGFPVVDDSRDCPRTDAAAPDSDGDEQEGDSVVVKETVKRPKGETPEERKARKEAVKHERASRRAEKKSTKDAFNSEVKRQKKIAGKAVAAGAAADVKGEGVRRLA